MYDIGRGIEQSNTKAMDLYQQACEAGEAQGCTHLGRMYYNGQGVSQDILQARMLFGKACDGGHADGCKYYARLKQEKTHYKKQ